MHPEPATRFPASARVELIRRLGESRRIVDARIFVAGALWSALFAGGLDAASADRFYTQRGDDPAFQQILESGELPRGRNSRGGVEGSTIRVEHDLLDTGPNADREIPDAIRIHTLGNSFIPRSGFPNWSRWYQEDRNTQIFRLFEGEENVRNSRKLAARIEAFSELEWTRGGWHEWVGTYTIIKPHPSAIFQVKNTENDWAMQLNMNSSGDVHLNHRRGKSRTLARNLVGKPFHVRIRDNGHDYEVYFNGEMKGEGSWARPKGKTRFRWGMYLGANELRHDAMIFVTGAGSDPRNYDRELARVGEPPEVVETPDEPQAPEGLKIPERVWRDQKGRAVRAPAIYRAGADFLHLEIDDEWVRQPLEKLSAEDRAAVRLAEDFHEP